MKYNTKYKARAANKRDYKYITTHYKLGKDRFTGVEMDCYLAPLANRLAMAQPIDYRTSLGKDRDRKEVATEMLAYFGQFSDLHELLKEGEFDNVKKLGPYSIKSPLSDRLPSILEYFKQRRFQPDQEAFTAAVLEIARLVPSKSLRKVSLESVYESADKKTNWGYPFPGNGATIAERHKELAEQIINSGTCPKLHSFLGWRGQPSGTSVPKQRVVWMYPHSIVLIELTYQTPALKVLKELDRFKMWKSIDEVSVPITHMLNLAEATGQEVLGFDATGFDNNTSAELISAAFWILKDWFQDDDTGMLDIICYYMIHSSLIISGGRIESVRNGGVPSGSGMTNLVDSIIQCIIYEYVKIRSGRSGDQSLQVVMGDDGVWYIIGLTLIMLTEFTAELGVVCNPSKQSFSAEYVTFCQRYFILAYREKDGIVRGIRSLIRTLNSMMSYERKSVWMDDPVFDTLRWISQIEDCKYHPLFNSFVMFIAGLDDVHALGYNVPGGPMSLFKMFGAEEFLKARGKGFLYTSELRTIDDLSKMRTVDIIEREIRARKV